MSANSSCDGIVCFAAVDWWYHNRGHSECQIMTRLARRGVPLLWINSIGLRVPKPGKTELVLHRYVRKLKSLTKGLRRDPSGMWVYTPIFVPRYTPRMVELNGALVASQISLICRILGMSHPAAFVTIPTAAPVVERLGFSPVVFNRSDDFSSFAEAEYGFVAPLEQRLLAQADSVLYVNRKLHQRERTSVRSAHYIGHGVDAAMFDADRARQLGVPERMRELPRPIVGYYGALDNYCVDLDLMIKTARHIPKGTLLVIGPAAMDVSRLTAEPNVLYLGPQPYSEIPRYASHFDVALMPWLQNDWIAACNPIKLKEYLALGLPFVTTQFPELAPFEHLAYVGATHEEFLAQLDKALEENDRGLRARRREAVSQDDWNHLTEKVAILLNLSDEQLDGRCICAG
jgi:glycosyltransferase involved in cell wall biosynthesis